MCNQTPSGVLTQRNLFDANYGNHLPFKGSGYVAELDEKRLTGQILRIRDAMADGKWRTLPEIENVTGDGQASVSAQLRNLRKPAFGSHQVDKRRRGEAERGIWEYKLTI